MAFHLNGFLSLQKIEVKSNRSQIGLEIADVAENSDECSDVDFVLVTESITKK